MSDEKAGWASVPPNPESRAVRFSRVVQHYDTPAHFEGGTIAAVYSEYSFAALRLDGGEVISFAVTEDQWESGSKSSRLRCISRSPAIRLNGNNSRARCTPFVVRSSGVRNGWNHPLTLHRTWEPDRIRLSLQQPWEQRRRRTGRS